MTVGAPSYEGFRFPAGIISHCVWLCHRFPLSLREGQEMMLARGIILSHETVRQWCAKFGQTYAKVLVTGKLASYGAARRRVPRSAGHRQSGYLNNRAGNSCQPTRARERAMTRFTSPPARPAVPNHLEPDHRHGHGGLTRGLGTGPTDQPCP